MAIANANVQTDVPQVSRILSALIAPAFVKAPVAMGLIHAEDVPEGQNTATKGFRKEGSMTAANLAEATVRALDANGHRADTAVDVVAAKTVVSTGVSVEASKFNDVALDSYARSQANAIARAVDNVILAEFTDFTQQQDCGDVITMDALDTAATQIIAANVPDPNVQLQFIGTAKAMRQLKADIRTSGSAMYANDKFLSVMNGNPQPNGYYGNAPGIDLYQTSGFSQSDGVDSCGLFHPNWAIAGIFDRAISTRVQEYTATGGLITELTSWFFYGVNVWNDYAGVEVLLTA